MQAVRKCLVWDLDNTLWDGVCLEGPVTIKPEVAEAVAELDRRGILQSIASRGDEDQALQTLRRFGLKEYFLVPKINWLSKPQNITAVARDLKLPLDSIAFIDDDTFEREQVTYMLPAVLTIAAGAAAELPQRPEFTPGELTLEARRRRQFYRAEIDRQHAQRSFSSREEFLLSCAMVLSVRLMEERDISRVMELMTRTHQLNTTGLMLERDDLQRLLRHDDNRQQVYVAELHDRFGDYGIIGTALVEQQRQRWRLKYLAISCRVMGRGIERAFLSTLIHHAMNAEGISFEAEFRDTGRNRMMRAMYQMMGFRPSVVQQQGTMTFRANQREVPDVPSWVHVS